MANRSHSGSSPLIAHVVPFALWLGILLIPWPTPAWNYAIRIGVCTLAFLMLRPWRGYDPPRVRQWPMAIATGVVVAVIWIGPETDVFRRMAPALADHYAGTLLGKPPGGPSPFAPETCGMWGPIVRLVGSTLCIAVIEEFFWRGCAYRYLHNADFTRVRPAFYLLPFMVITVAFGLEHSRWLVGMVAGIAYTGLYVATGDLWTAVVAHVTTNACLGVYVLATGNYQFW